MAENNLKIQNTKTKLLRALCKLLQRKNLSDLTVSELCREAQVSRAAFYRHFDVPMDILTEYFGDLFSRNVTIDDSFTRIPDRDEVYGTLLAMCQAYKKNRELFQKLTLSASDLAAMVRGTLPGVNFAIDLSESGIYSYIAGGVTAIIIQWAMQEFTQPPEVIAQILTEYTVKLLFNS